MNIDTFDDSMLQHLSRLGQGHFGIVELCTYEIDPLMRPGFNELVAVKRYDIPLLVYLDQDMIKIHHI